MSNPARKITNLLHSQMDDGSLHERSVADACLQYMSEAEVVEMAESFGLLDNDIFEEDE